jgi:prolyl oligopeptidase
MPELKYPHTAAVDQVDDYHGTLVADPFRWLEDTDSPQTRLWIEAQNKLTFSFLDTIPEREALRQRLTELWDYPKVWAPLKKGDRYFQLRNTGLQNQDVLYVLEDLQAEPRLLLDPNTLSSDGTIAVTAWEPSPDGRWLAYATSASGSDWLTWRVRDVDTGTDLPDLVEWSKFSGAAWLQDNSGFYYARYDAPETGQEYLNANYYQKLYFHTLNTLQAKDSLVYQRPDQKEWGFGTQVSDEGRYLIINIWQGTEVRNRLFYQDLHAGGPVIELISALEASYIFLGNDGPLFYLRTDLDAPRGRIILVDIRQPDKAFWRTLVPESQDVIEAAKLLQDIFISVELHDAYHQLRCYGLDGTPLGEIPLPTLGSIVLMENWGFNASRRDRDLFIAFHSFALPTTIYRYTLRQEGLETLFTPPIQFDFTPYVTHQVFISSKDGTQVPLFLVHRREMPNEPQPTFLYGYGGFNISLTPAFAISRLAWLERGGVLAVANLRGGGEYGEEWHQAGSLENKQNVFDDFIACAEYLITQGITRSDKLAINGGSNGGLLVGACLAQRPDLFGAAIPAVGVLDMLRFHKFTIGWAWVSDYGSADDPGQFKNLYAYSPLHNLKPGTAYPPTLILTADHDDRVVPGHSFKFTAALQAAQGGAAPVLIRIQTKAGHGFGKPTAILIEEQADLWAFVIQVLRMSDSEA